MGLHLLPDDLGFVPSSEADQDFLLRLLCHVACLSGSVDRNESAFVEALAEKMGRSGWEFPEAPRPIEPGEIARLHTSWRGSAEKIWLVNLLRKLAVADGFVDEDEELFLEELAGRLFATSPRRYEMPRSRLSPEERGVIEAAESAASLCDTRYWHRKTQKVVGAAVGVAREGEFFVFRGVNFELSQPTGSRCAEQIALGSALVHFSDSLRHRDIRMIAVVAGPNVPKPVPNPLPPCGVCCEMIHKLNEEDGQIQLYMVSGDEDGSVLRIPFTEYYPPRVG